MGEHEHPCFFCWLAGFIDGEGCFFIKRNRYKGGSTTYSLFFAINVRIDDKAVLDEIVRRTGIGRVFPHRIGPRAKEAVPGAWPQVRWEVGTKRDCAKLVCFLEEHPQHAKKRRDYEVWAKAVQRWQTKRPTGGRFTTDWSDMARLKRELEAVRSSGLDGSEPIPDDVEAEHQLLLDPGAYPDQAQVE